jgi:hypothetical protein
MPSYSSSEVVLPSVIDMIDDDTTAVVELGCGWGRNLFMLYNLLAHDRPSLMFFGGELSDTGLAAARRVAALEPSETRISFYGFDYLAPDLSFLSGHQKVTFFTCHSVEQVGTIGTKLFEEMLGAVPHVRCVHGEPVGWQFNADLLSKTTTGQFDGRSYSGDLSLFAPVNDEISAAMPVYCGWNRDLMSVLQDIARRNLIRLEYVEPHCGGDNYYNPTTLIGWTKI